MYENLLYLRTVLTQYHLYGEKFYGENRDMSERCTGFFRKMKKYIRYGCSIAVIGIMVLFGTDGYVKAKAKDAILSEDDIIQAEKKADAILVLGAQVRADGQPSTMLKERLNTGIQLYKEGVSDRIIMSGDHGSEDYDEVNAMKSYAIGQGVPSECIFMDHAGFSTYDSMYRAKDIFQADSLVVVTQQYHLYRALYDAMAFDIDVQGVACDTAVYDGDAYRKSREVLARFKDVGFTLVKPKPAYLGETIPLSGSGDVTNDKEDVDG